MSPETHHKAREGTMTPQEVSGAVRGRERPVLLDLYAGGGGSAVGYSQAGFRVIGVDLDPKPLRHYPFPHLCDDALETLARLTAGERLVFSDGNNYGQEDIAAIQASPPCHWTRAGKLREAQGYQSHKAKLLAPTRAALECLDLPWVIENVPGAPMRHDIILCGSMFGLKVRRHRWFESNITMPLASPCNHTEQGRPVGVYHRMNDEIPSGGRTAKSLVEAQKAMGIDWMIWDELKEAIPSVYTEFIGVALMRHLESR